MKPSTLGTAIALFVAGCASPPSLSPTALNSKEQTEALVAKFSQACEKAHGSIGQPTLQGSFGVCKTVSGATVNMYINSSFILIQGDAENIAKKFYLACSKNQGQITDTVVRNGKPAQLTEGKTMCKSSNWNATHEFVKSGAKMNSLVFVSFPRDRVGNVSYRSWDLSFSFFNE